MKVSDYIVQFLEEKGITDIFGYPGVGCGHFMDSLKDSKIESHLVYHEQAAAFAACSYAQASHKVGLAYTTAGPGGTNLITGIANAFCDSIPTLFIVGDKDLSSLRRNYNVRQMASQEIDIVDIARPTTKFSVQVTDAADIKYYLEKAFYEAESGRPGPVLLDIPSDIQRAEIEPDDLRIFEKKETADVQPYLDEIVESLQKSQKALILVGNGIKQAGLENRVLNIAKQLNVPIVTTLVCFDLYADEKIKLGYIGLDGDSAANRAVSKCDLIITLGARLNFKQVCNKRENFAPNAKIIRIDCDQGELEYRLRDEVAMCADVNLIIPGLENLLSQINPKNDVWLTECVGEKANGRKSQAKNAIAAQTVAHISKQIPEKMPVVVDVGSHRRWVMSNFDFKEGQRLYQSAGLVSMGYALPAAIGAYYACHKPVLCFDGDGGLMMNLQEMQFINRERIPITIVVFNNHCLGDIMEFQKKIFSGNYFTTTEQSGYLAADFERIAKAFHIKYECIETVDKIATINFNSQEPQLIEVIVPSNT